MILRYLRAIWRFTGLIAALFAWAIIILSISQNPWFDLYKHALSDLGDPVRANKPWIYNLGLIITGVLTCIYSLYLTYVASNKIHVFASAMIFVAGIFLALIGLYPSGTRPHVFVSTWFFIQIWISMLAFFIEALINRRRLNGVILGLITVIGPLGALLIKWPSTALLEIYGIILVDIYVIILTISF
ncbi:MAG: DUF998 domain-containing protein [Sulfolobales archaeon]